MVAGRESSNGNPTPSIAAAADEWSEALAASLLRTLPKERLVALLQDALSPRDLGARIAALRGSGQAPSNPVQALGRLTRDQLVRLVIDLGIDESTATREFNEYRFTQRPSLYLRTSSSPITAERLEPEAITEHLETALAALNDRLLAEEDLPTSRAFRLEGGPFVDADGLTEIRYSVQHRVDLVDPDTLRPRSEYTAALGAAWLDPASRLCLINASRVGDADHMAAAIAAALDMPHLYPVTLTDALLVQVVDEDNIKSSAFVRSEGGTRPRSIRLSDEDLVGKSSYGELRADGGYRPTYGYYRQRLPGATEASTRFGVGMTRRAGRIWIPYPLARAELADWAKRFMRTIAGQQAHFLESQVSEAVATSRAAIVSAMPASWNRPGRRESLLALLSPIAECRTQGLERYPIGAAPLDLARDLKAGWLAVLLEQTCESCGRDVTYPCPSCDRPRFGVEPDVSFACRSCAAAFEASANLTTRCECGEDVALDATRDLTLYPTMEFIDLVDALLRVVDPKLNLERRAFLVEGSDLRLLEDRGAPRVLRLDDVAEFRQPAAFAFYAADVRQTVAHRLDRCEAGLEKCRPFDREKSEACWPCDSCSPSEHRDRECLRTVVIDRIGDGKIEPHTGTEIGDLVFDVTVNGERLKAIAFGKGHGSELRSTTSEGRALLSQVWQWHDDDDFQVIAILSSALVAQNMRLAVEGMARYGQKSVLYLGRPEVERLLAENIASGSDKGPSAGHRCSRK